MKSVTEKESLSEFERVDLVRQIEYLRESMNLRAPTKIWIKGQQKKIDTFFGVIFESDQTFTVTGKNKAEIRAFCEALSQDQQTDCIAGIALQKAYLFFKTRFKRQNHTELVFELPKDLYQVQRREGIRVQISDLKQLWVEFKHPSIEYKKLKGKVLDLNEKGMGFILYEEELTPDLNSGTELKSFQFTLRGHPISTSAEIRNTRVVSSPGKQLRSIRVGVLFKNLSNHDTQLIAAYVLEESEKAFSSLVFD